MASSNTLPSTFQSPHSSPSLHPTPTMEKEYEFFVTTNEPHQPDGPERGLIRRLVMRNFFESKWSGPSNNSSEHNSASTVQAKTKLKSRFRLGKPGQETTDAKCKPRSRNPGDRGNKEEGEKVEKRPRVSRTLSTQSGLSYRSGKSGGSSRRASPAEDINSGMSKPRLLLKINPNAHRFDPFDVLPVPGTPELDTLFKLCKLEFFRHCSAISRVRYGKSSNLPLEPYCFLWWKPKVDCRHQETRLEILRTRLF